MSLDGASHHKVWIAMMRKVAQPESFLPEGMPGGAARPGWPRPDMALPDLHKAMTRHLVRLGGRGARVRRPACQASCRCAPTDPSLSPRWSTRCSRRARHAYSSSLRLAREAASESVPLIGGACEPRVLFPQPPDRRATRVAAALSRRSPPPRAVPVRRATSPCRSVSAAALHADFEMSRTIQLARELEAADAEEEEADLAGGAWS